MKYLIFLFVILTTPAFSGEPCDDLWFTRNLIIDRTGYCFGSPLGQSVFDNADCTTKSPQLGPDDAKKVALVKKREVFWECKIDISRKSLDLDMLQARMQLQDLPVVNENNFTACLEWQGPEIALKAAHNSSFGHIGKIMKGDELFFYYDDVGKWMFVSAYRSDHADRIGWANMDMASLRSQCTSLY